MKFCNPLMHIVPCSRCVRYDNGKIDTNFTKAMHPDFRFSPTLWVCYDCYSNKTVLKELTE